MENRPNFSTIKSWHKDERPREKAMAKGIDSITDAELLAILISTGTKDRSALDVARDLLSTTDNNFYQLGRKTVADFKKIKGLGLAKAVILAAAFEVGRRRQAAAVPVADSFKCSADIYEYIGPLLADLVHEEFWVIFLSRAGKLISTTQVFKGGLNAVSADARVIMRKTVELAASTIILVHNHPSGSLQPSTQDIDFTNKMKEVCGYFDVFLADHVIVAGKQYYSFLDNGRL